MDGHSSRSCCVILQQEVGLDPCNWEQLRSHCLGKPGPEQGQKGLCAHAPSRREILLFPSKNIKDTPLHEVDPDIKP